MHLKDLEYLNTYTVAKGHSFYRLQCLRSTATTVKRGPLKLAPAGLLGGRFDLTAKPTAYFAESPHTALYEAIFRREATFVSLALLGQRELIATQLTKEVELGDLRPHSSAWPVLQSLRHSQTQELAASAHAAGLAGFLYRSAQQFGEDCIVLFDPAADATKLLWRSLLVNADGALNRWAVEALDGSRVPLAP